MTADSMIQFWLNDSFVTDFAERLDGSPVEEDIDPLLAVILCLLWSTNKPGDPLYDLSGNGTTVAALREAILELGMEVEACSSEYRERFAPEVASLAKWFNTTFVFSADQG